MKTVYVNINDNLSIRKIRRIAKRLFKISKKEDIVVALNKKLLKNETLKYYINDFGLKILNGKWLFKFMLKDIIKYVCMIEKAKSETRNIALLTNSKDEIIMGQIVEIAKEVKSLKIISNSLNSFEYIEEELYIDYGIGIQITNNKRKSLINTDIIINVDYDENELNKYNIKQNAILINLQNDVNLKNFFGVNINDYKIDYNRDNLKILENENDYESNIIYESYIYRNDTLSNIQKQLKNDNVRLTGLIQNNGKYYLKKALDKQKILA